MSRELANIIAQCVKRPPPQYIKGFRVLEAKKLVSDEITVTLSIIYFGGFCEKEKEHSPVRFILPHNTELKPNSFVLDLVDDPDTNCRYRLRGRTLPEFPGGDHGTFEELEKIEFVKS